MPPLKVKSWHQNPMLMGLLSSILELPSRLLRIVTCSLISDQEWTIQQTTKFSTLMRNPLMVNVLSRWNWIPKAWLVVKIELTQVFNQQTSSALSYHPSVNYPPSSSSYRSPAPLIETPCKPHTHGSYASSMNISPPPKNHLQDKKVPAIPSSLSYSAAAKKAGDVPQVLILTRSVCDYLSSQGTKCAAKSGRHDLG